jgi:putative NADPH-quinone reductase
MRILVVRAHPAPESFNAAIGTRLVQGLAAAGHEVHDLDLYAAGFDPVMRAPEWRADYTQGANTALVADQLAHLRWAEGLILVYPTWFHGPPAMLKGWIERVFVPHETFVLRDAPNPIAGRLANIRLLGGIATYGAPWWWIRLVVRDPGRAVVMKGLKPLCARNCRSFWLGLYRMDQADEARRRAFLGRVEALAARL